MHKKKGKFKNHVGVTRVVRNLWFYTKLFNDFLCIYQCAFYCKIVNDLVLL